MMHNSPKVSIIVPVYNTERYLDKCLQSLLGQTLDSIEIIVVNDGSPDASQSIINRYVSEYPGKIIALQQENKGLGAARNVGLEHSAGEYIAFVDSDDWVDEDMYRQMYDKAYINNSDVVICDLICVNEADRKQWVSAGYRGIASHTKTVADFVMYSMDPAFACNKLFNKSLFNIVCFPDTWYEDVATIPILLSYAQHIEYLSVPLYFYLQRRDAITAQVGNVRNLEIMQGWERCLLNANKIYRQEISYAVYSSIKSFIAYRHQYRAEYLGFLISHKDLINGNALIRESVKMKTDMFSKLVRFLADDIDDAIDIADENFKGKKTMIIPKIIHYCWFGCNPKSETIEKCIASWRKHLPDYEIMEWNESNCDISSNEFARTAYEAKKWAFVADYFRFKILYEHGGLYMDTDMLVHKSLDDFLIYNAFFGIETFQYVNACILGTIPLNNVIKYVLDTYETGVYSSDGGTVCHRITDVLQKRCGLTLTGQTQFLSGNIAVFAPNILTIDVSDGKCAAEHLYDGSWVNEDDYNSGASYKHEVLKQYFGNPHTASSLLPNSGELNAHLKSLLGMYSAPKLIRRIIKIKLRELWKGKASIGSTIR